MEGDVRCTLIALEECALTEGSGGGDDGPPVFADEPFPDPPGDEDEDDGLPF